LRVGHVVGGLALWLRSQTTRLEEPDELLATRVRPREIGQELEHRQGGAQSREILLID